jgi:hypothetical protein
MVSLQTLLRWEFTFVRVSQSLERLLHLQVPFYTFHHAPTYFSVFADLPLLSYCVLGTRAQVLLVLLHVPVVA